MFTKEDVTCIPVPDSRFGGGCKAKLVDIVIDSEIVAAKLRNFKSDTTAGDGGHYNSDGVIGVERCIYM